MTTLNQYVDEFRAAGVPRRIIKRKDRSELKKFVMDYCDGLLLTSLQVPIQDAHTVFLPVTMGAFDLPEEVEALLGGPPPLPPLQKEPQKPLPDRRPEVEPDKDPKPPKLVELEQRLVDLKRDLSWGEAEETDLANLLNTIQPLREDWDRYEAPFEAARAAREQRYLDQVQQYLVDHEVWEAQQTQRDLALAQHEAAMEDYGTRRKALLQVHFEDLGLFYEYYNTAGPRGFNGFPMFLSMYLMHHEDWALAKQAIARELKRREDFDPFEGLDES